MNIYVYVILGAILSAITPIFIGLYIKNGSKNPWLIGIATLASVILVYIYWILCKSNNTSQIYTLIKILSIVLVAGAGIVFLREPMSKRNFIGIIFAILALILLMK